MKRDELINKLQQLDPDTILVIEDRHGNLYRALDLWTFQSCKIESDEPERVDEYYHDSDGNHKTAMLVNEGSVYENSL